MHVAFPGIRGFVLQTGLTRQRAPIVGRVPLLLKRRFLESRWLVEFVRNERVSMLASSWMVFFSRRIVACYGHRWTKIAVTILQGRLAIDNGRQNEGVCRTKVGLYRPANCRSKFEAARR